MPFKAGSYGFEDIRRGRNDRPITSEAIGWINNALDLGRREPKPCGCKKDHNHEPGMLHGCDYKEELDQTKIEPDHQAPLSRS